MAREGKHKDREGAEGSSVSGVVLHLRAAPGSLHNEKDDDVRNTGQHKGAEVLEGIELLGVGKRPDDDGDDKDPKPSLGGHHHVPRLALLRRPRGALVIIKVRPTHNRERITDHNKIRNQDTNKVNQEHNIEECREDRGDLITDPSEAHINIRELAVVLLLLPLVELVAHIGQEVHPEVAEGAHKKNEDDADDEAELVHGHGKTEDTGADDGVDEGDLAGQDGGDLLDLGELAVVLEGWGTVDLDNVVVLFESVVGNGHVLGDSLELDLMRGTGAEYSAFVNAEPFGHSLW